jgi:hypothetical protein
LRCFQGITIKLNVHRYPPFYDNEPIGIYKKILSGILEFPRFFDLKVKDLIRKLLNPDLNLRLGVNDVLGFSYNFISRVNPSRSINGLGV